MQACLLQWTVPFLGAAAVLFIAVSLSTEASAGFVLRDTARTAQPSWASGGTGASREGAQRLQTKGVRHLRRDKRQEQVSGRGVGRVARQIAQNLSL